MPGPVPDVVVATMHPKQTVPMPLPETRPAPESRPAARLVVGSMDSRVVAMTAVPTPEGPGPFPITATTTTTTTAATTTTTTTEPKAKKAVKSGEMALKTKATTTTTTTEPKAKKTAKSGEMAVKAKATTTTTEPKAKKAAKSGEIALKTKASTGPLMKDIAKPTSRPAEECKITWERPAQGPAPGPCRARLSTRGRRKRTTTTTTPYDKKSSNREASPQPSTSGYVPPTRRPNPPPPATRQREAVTHISESEDEDVRQTPQKLATVCRISPMAPKTQELNAEDILSSQILNAAVELFSENQSLAMEELGLVTIDMFTTQFEPVEGFDDEVSDLFECGQKKFYEPDYVEPTPTMDLGMPTMHEAALLSSGVMRKLN
ncbi:transcriptional regulatory protein AlgP-like [Procambarus clarkii]|uniref:transcriptional regulatory protein AlgP-like n=1 Tax=Procambarus clarkii TaxID=6728 RepID=UPI0037422E13